MIKPRGLGCGRFCGNRKVHKMNDNMKEKRLSAKAQMVLKSLVVVIVDIISLIACSVVALWIRYEFSLLLVPEDIIYYTNRNLIYHIVTCVAVYYCFRLYHSIWRYVGTSEVLRIVLAYCVLIPILITEHYFLRFYLPRSYYLIMYVLDFISCVGIRFSYRFFRDYVLNSHIRGKKDEDRIMIIGGGQTGRTIIREMQVVRAVEGRVVCIIDDDPGKWRRSLEGVPIVGGRYDIAEMVAKYDITYIIYCIPGARPEDRREILRLCNETGCKLKSVPAVFQLLNGDVSVSKLRNVDIAELLGRDEIKVNNNEIMEAIGGKVIMVTGGGGSIGSELCRQIAAAGPKQLIIFDIYENNTYDVQQELKKKYPELDLVTLIGSVRNTNRVNYILKKYKPHTVFHAAAHKHVPLMEDSPNEDIKNNVIGTYKMATAAAENGVKRFLLISTDKAVNPTNIMGASKRLCEMVVQMMNRRYEGTDFVAVRFGNVLGSNGSVIPLFKKQIAEGGPVTVTDKNIIRYFMTIPEAVSLVLQASFYAKGGEIFVLDMGDPVRIDDMARNLIRLSGYKPDIDIKIVY
ncbi:MAG: polysaccharide biosynthesis protein, partial [Lachnospiraceae bacterium]|nr:polysaccharide biosynthesis protein [Lachnospiraceae bacterium]